MQLTLKRFVRILKPVVREIVQRDASAILHAHKPSLMKAFLLLLASLATAALHAQNCAQTSVGLPPLNVLGTSQYGGYAGGLYPGGSNTLPPAHLAAGMAMASGMTCRGASGAPSASGKIVWLSIGLSNTTQETQVFLPMAASQPGKNPSLVLVDGAQGGDDIDSMLNPTSDYWPHVAQQLQAAGVTPAQVQVVWFKQAKKQPTDTVFPNHAMMLKAKYKTAMQLLKTRFPNLRLCYHSSRIYGGYSAGILNPEPYAWQGGWATKWLIEDQIAGDTALTFSGAAVRAPWLAWGPYLWADGTTVNPITGLSWICPTDFSPDGVHPSTAGRQKVAAKLLQFFTTDTTTKGWFLGSGCSTTGIAEAAPGEGFTVFPNPARTELAIRGAEDSDVEIVSVAGRQMALGRGIRSVDISGWPAGVYVVVLRSDDGTWRQRFVKQ